MKLIDWRIMLSRNADTCKHTQFTCNECGSVIFRIKIETKTSRLQTQRLFKRLRKLAEIEELNLEANK